MRRDDDRLRSRLVAALVAATALAFVVTVAAVAAAPAPQQGEGAAPPSTTEPSQPTTTSATPEPPRTPTGDRRPESRGDAPPARSGPDDEAEGGAGTETAATAPAPEPAPSEPPPSEEPPATSDADRAPAPTDHGARLWGRWFRAEEIREGDVRVLVAGDHPLYVGFVRQEGGDGLVWMTSCNTFGGELTVGRQRLRVRDIGGTAVGCEDDNQHDQEEWLEGFFGAGPRWLTAGDQLRLWTPDGRRIDLREDPEGPGAPWS